MNRIDAGVFMAYFTHLFMQLNCIGIAIAIKSVAVVRIVLSFIASYCEMTLLRRILSFVV